MSFEIIICVVLGVSLAMNVILQLLLWDTHAARNSARQRNRDLSRLLNEKDA